MLLRHDALSYSWLFRFQTSLEDSFVAYLLSDLVDDVQDIPSMTSRYFRLDMVRSTSVPVASLCVDESESCATVDERSSPRCKTDTESETSPAAPALACPRACGLCNATRPAVCKFPPEMVGDWHDGVNVSDASFRLRTAANRKTIVVVMTTTGELVLRQRFHCIRWNTSPASGERTTHGNRFNVDEFLLVGDPSAGCRRRYACAQLLFKTPSVIYFRLSEQRTWPFTSSALAKRTASPKWHVRGRAADVKPLLNRSLNQRGLLHRSPAIRSTAAGSTATPRDFACWSREIGENIRSRATYRPLARGSSTIAPRSAHSVATRRWTSNRKHVIACD